MYMRLRIANEEKKEVQRRYGDVENWSEISYGYIKKCKIESGHILIQI